MLFTDESNVTDVKGSGDAMENVMLPATSFSMTGLLVVGLGRHIPGCNKHLEAIQTTEYHFELLQ